MMLCGYKTTHRKKLQLDLYWTWLRLQAKRTLVLSKVIILCLELATYTLEILENNLDVLEKDNVLIDNLEKILEHNATLVSSLIIILADKKVDFFSKFLVVIPREMSH